MTDHYDRSSNVQERPRNQDVPIPARLLPPTEIHPDAHAVLANTPTGLNGNSLNLFLVLAHSPDLLQAVNRLAGAFRRCSISPLECEIVILRVAAVCDCEYIFDKHSWLAVKYGLNCATIEALCRDGQSNDWTEEQQLLVDFTNAILDGMVNEHDWQQLASMKEHAFMVELVTLISFYRMVCSLVAAFRIPNEESPVVVMP